jgi:hypothetical protein
MRRFTVNQTLADGIVDRTTETVLTGGPDGGPVDEVTRVSLLQGAAIVTLLAELVDRVAADQEAEEVEPFDFELDVIEPPFGGDEPV